MVSDRKTVPTPKPEGIQPGPLAVDAKRITEELFPDISLRSWRRLDSSHRCPAGFFMGKRKVWRRRDLEMWSIWGFPDRRDFEQRLTEK